MKQWAGTVEYIKSKEVGIVDEVPALISRASRRGSMVALRKPKTAMTYFTEHATTINP